MPMPAPELQRTFERIDNTNVYVSYPEPKDGGKAGGKAPRVILIFGWMEAPLSHLHRFTEMYNQIYPSATQILVRTYRKSLFAELPTNKTYVLPVVKLLHDAGIKGYDPPESSGLLVHSISNGGAMAQTYLAHCLADTHPTPPLPPKTSALPAQALIYDSVPSSVSPSVFFNFFTTGIPSPTLRTIVKPFLIPAYLGTVLYRNTLDRRPDTFTTIRTEMSDGRLMPQNVPQVFIYGDADLLTPAESVESYVTGVRERLKKEGVDGDRMIMVEKYAGSPHVSHAKRDPKRYWAAVVRVWEASCQNGRTGPDGNLRCKL